jgi:hypothetical protein
LREVLGDHMGHLQTNINPKPIIQKIKAANRLSKESLWKSTN